MTDFASTVLAKPLGERLLERAAQDSSLISDTLRRHGDAPLLNVLSQFQPRPLPCVQARDDLWDVIERTASPYCGSDIAREAVAELRDDPVLSTANHFGVDTLAVSVQETLLFALRPRRDGSLRRGAVVLGCSSVGMGSLTYPMGLLIYDHQNSRPGRLVNRLPVHSKRFKQWMVGSAPPFDERMVGRAWDRLRAMRRSGEITPFGERAAARALAEDYASGDVVGQDSYVRQAAHINAGIWSRMFASPSAAIRPVQLSFEETAAALLAKDLRDPGSLVHTLFFTPDVRATLLTVLDGTRACWRLRDLRLRLEGPAPDPKAGDGTVFFWGVTENGGRIPLTLDERGSTAVLVGVDRKHRRWEWEFTPEACVAALTRGELIPSLLTGFVELAFARGVSCVGGPYQAAFLPIMQLGVVNAIRQVDPGAAELIAQVPTQLSLAGMHFAMRRTADGLGIPVGPLEIAEAGGLTESDLHHIATSITTREAYLAALPDVFPHFLPDVDGADGWLERLAAENEAGLPNIIRFP